MPRPFHRSELQGATIVWLLVVSYAGREFRFSSYPVAPLDVDGVAHPFDGGLDSVEYADALDLLEGGTSPQSISFPSVHFPLDVAQLVARGHDLATATAEVSQWVSGQAWENRRRLLSGRLVNPQYGGAGEPLAFSVEENAYDDRALVPSLDARVNATTWPSRNENEDGRYYPEVFGQPGVFTRPGDGELVRAGSPVRIVQDSAGTAQKVLIAGHRVASTTVEITDGAANQSFGVTHEQDGATRVVAVCDISTPGAIDATAGAFWCRWDDGGARLAADGVSVLEGAGDVLAHFLRRSSLPVDEGRLAAAAGYLNRFRLAGWFGNTEAMSPWEWLQDNVLPLLPVSIRTGPGGLYPVVWRWDATAQDALDTLRAGAGVVRSGPVTYSRSPGEIRNAWRFSYCHHARLGHYARYLVLTAEPDAGTPEELTSLHAQISARRYGRSEAELSSDVVYDNATAALVLDFLVRSEGFAHRVVSYEVAHSWAWLEPGDVLLLTDADLHLVDQLALVQELSWSDPGSLSLSLLILEDPVLDARST